MKFKLKLPRPSARTKRRHFERVARRWAGYGFAGLVLFLAFVWFNLPTRAIAWRISEEAKKRGHLVSIGDLSISPFGSLVLRDVTWSFAPTRRGERLVPFTMAEVELDLSLLGALAGKWQVGLDAQLDEGAFSGQLDWGEEEVHVVFDIRDVPLYALPRVQQSVHAPVAGAFSAHVDITAPERKFEQAHGSISLSCSGCSVGDGEESVYIPGARGFLADGITLPEIRLGELSGKLVVANGVATAEAFEAVSDDLTLQVAGELLLRDPVQKSRFEIVIKLLVNERLREDNDSIHLLLSTASKKSKMAAPFEGWLGFRLRGSVGRPRFTGINAKTREQKVREARDRRRERAEDRRKRTAATSKSKAKAKAKAKAKKQERKELEAKKKEEAANGGAPEDARDLGADKSGPDEAPPDGTAVGDGQAEDPRPVAAPKERGADASAEGGTEHPTQEAEAEADPPTGKGQEGQEGQEGQDGATSGAKAGQTGEGAR